jgi:hypothetical protein
VSAFSRKTGRGHVGLPRAMPVRGLGRHWPLHWLWGNRQPEPLNLEVPIVCRHISGRHALLISTGKIIFPRANAILARAQALLWVRFDRLAMPLN